jgi:hypothetical protein
MLIAKELNTFTYTARNVTLKKWALLNVPMAQPFFGSGEVYSH